MADKLDHDRMRFKSMSVNQLQTRLGRITHEQKMRNFIQCCVDWGNAAKGTAKGNYEWLKNNAITKYRQMFGSDPGSFHPSWGFTPEFPGAEVQAQPWHTPEYQKPYQPAEEEGIYDDKSFSLPKAPKPKSKTSKPSPIHVPKNAPKNSNDVIQFSFMKYFLRNHLLTVEHPFKNYQDVLVEVTDDRGNVIKFKSSDSDIMRLPNKVGINFSKIEHLMHGKWTVRIEPNNHPVPVPTKPEPAKPAELEITGKRRLRLD